LREGNGQPLASSATVFFVLDVLGE